LSATLAPPYKPAGPVAEAFHRSNAFARGLMGPVGSSKSSACWQEMFTRATEQAPNAAGVRRFRCAVLRNTYPELTSTTIRTVQEWCPALKFNWGSPITAKLRGKLPDGTTLDFECMFLALERPEEVDKIGSLEITAGWINEVREVAKAIFDKLTERVGRFPKIESDATGKQIYGPTWRGVVMDTNPPSDDHWYYKIAEKSDPEITDQTEQAEKKLRELGYLKPGEPLFAFFKQPGGLIAMADNEYEPNPAAENIQNLDGGYAYYYRQIAGKKKEWIKAQILGQYAVITDGKAVYGDYSDELHCRKTDPLRGLPIIIGLDYGRSPAAVFMQLTARGQLRVFDELWGDDIGIEAFAEDVVKPHIGLHYREFDTMFVGDPAGMAKESDERNAFDVLADVGIVAIPAHTNRLTGRLEAVRHYLNRNVGGQPAFVLDPRCSRLRSGFLGRYYFKRVQVSENLFKETPEKNEYSHPHDSLQYGALYARMEDVGGGRFKEKLNYPPIGIRA
jgi:hypothetical protein